MVAPKELVDRIDVYRENRDHYRLPSYKEFRLRREFVDVLFECFGWDVANKSGYAEAYKDVVHEDSIKIAGASKAPDYAFRIGGQRKFFVETKAPAVNIREDSDSAFQLRRYGWSAKLPLSILTNFEELAVYDCRIKPDRHDKASTARLMCFGFEEYGSRWGDIAKIFSRESILRGSFDKYASDSSKKRGTAEVDEAFLGDIESWRSALARNIALRNKDLSIRDLNTAVQRTIDRIVFLRIAEDRGIEQYGRLRALSKGNGVYARLARLFLQADGRYNSGLFHFRNEGGMTEAADAFTLRLDIDDPVLKNIFSSLYFPESPYEFSVLPANILGQVYEQFLGKVIRFSGRSAIVEEKPEVKKAGGVYYTPIQIVRYIVEHAIGPLLVGRTPLQVAGLDRRAKTSVPLRVLDPACGSGSFLIEAYQYLLDWYRDRYIEEGPKKYAKGKEPKLYEAMRGEWRLTIAERRRILLTHIFGVDIDPQAVEVSKLSLLLKVLEGESSDALASQMNFFHIRALPDLANNIQSGNSLVDTDIVATFLGELVEEEETYRNNPFNWVGGFPFLKENDGFDAIVGNPPYIDSEWMTKHWPHERRYCTDKYPYARGNWDIFCAFIGKAVDLAKPGGNVALIVPNKLMTSDYAREIRRYLLDNGFVRHIRDYSAIKVFPVAVYPIIFTYTKGVDATDTTYEKMEYEDGVPVGTVRNNGVNLGKQFSKGEEWQFHSDRKLKSSGKQFDRLGDLATITDAATVAEAYTLAELLSNKASPSSEDLRFVNSGTIDPYVSLWGLRPTRYIKKSYEFPVLEAKNINRYHANRIRQARAKKLLVANMTQKG